MRNLSGVFIRRVKTAKYIAEILIRRQWFLITYNVCSRSNSSSRITEL